ncbi:MAG: NERD domain-containing protein [Bacilli bacterium]|nr:NERD domain-containing protein [Bacilli bacterium]MDD4733972.1 NERD domain-containing protein [Bacilli bacterium]
MYQGINIYKFYFDLIIETITNTFFLLILVFGLLSAIFGDRVKGWLGEFRARLKLLRLPKDKYLLLSNIMIKDENGTHQIDHLVISQYGIFVIEVKNYNGLIVGNEYKDKWIQYLGKKKYYMNNPIHQNYGHIKALANLLNMSDDLFISVICNADKTNLKVESKSIITQTSSLKNKLLEFNEIKIEKSVEEIKDIILANNIVDKKMNKQHIKDIKIKISEDKEKENNMICPKCGSQLVQRNGKYGMFTGCSGFPKCRYIKK